MNNHKFVPADKGISIEARARVWMVYCTKTGGSFSTEVWRTGKVPKDHLPSVLHSLARAVERI